MRFNLITMPKIKIINTEWAARNDRLPLQERGIQRVRMAHASVASFYGFEKVFLSPIEHVSTLSVFSKAGIFTDRTPVSVRTKEGEEWWFRISGALSLIRAHAAHKMNEWPQPLKFQYDGESFFYTRDGGIESRSEEGLVMIGEESPVAEAEILYVFWKTVEDAGLDISCIRIRLNATGCTECRPHFRSAFTSYLRSRSPRLCKNCKKYLRDVPTRILTCQEEKCQIVARQAPQVLDFLCEKCKKHLRGLLEFFDESRLSYVLDAAFFQEGSWFEEVIFELIRMPAAGGSAGQGEGGDRNDSFNTREGRVLAEGGRLTRAGRALMEKHLDIVNGILFPAAVASVLVEEGKESRKQEKVPLFLAQLGELAKRKSFKLIELVRREGIGIRESLGRDSIKSQLNNAERVGAEIALIVGQKEALDETVIVREVDSGIQETVPQEKLVEFLKKKLKK